MEEQNFINVRGNENNLMYLSSDKIANSRKQPIEVSLNCETSFVNVDSYKCLWAFIGCYTRFSGLQSSLGITNGNRSHNKPLELN